MINIVWIPQVWVKDFSSAGHWVPTMMPTKKAVSMAMMRLKRVAGGGVDWKRFVRREAMMTTATLRARRRNRMVRLCLAIGLIDGGWNDFTGDDGKLQKHSPQIRITRSCFAARTPKKEIVASCDLSYCHASNDKSPFRRTWQRTYNDPFPLAKVRMIGLFANNMFLAIDRFPHGNRNLD